MLHDLPAALAGFIVATISAGGYGGIVALMAIESACIPLPSEIIMPFSGYLVSTGRFDLILVATAGALGCNLGSTLAYLAGRYGGRRLVERWGRYVLIGPGDLQASDRFFARFGGFAVLVGRLLPVVRTFISLPAGIARLPLLRFQIYTFVGSWPWCFALAYIGYQLGEHWNTDPRLRAVMHQFDLVILAIVVVGAAWHVWRHVRHRKG
jgi:membrane protein DedA with SNARE-associated domain